MTEYRIGLYDENGTLIGYKADTFWNLTKKPEYAKLHSLENGRVAQHLIDNLASVLKADFEGDCNYEVSKTIEALKTRTKRRFFGNFETLLIGYSLNGDAPTFTHRAFPQGIELYEEQG